jgi:hypothetical protein
MEWESLEGFDCRYGVPMTPAALKAFESLSEEDRAVLLPRLEAATFEVVTQFDIDQLPSTDQR